MASGVEVVGLVLGTIPLIIAGLEFYAKGVATSKRFWRYRREIDSLLFALRTEEAVFNNSINILLVDILYTQDMPAFLADPFGIRWKDQSFDTLLRDRLKSSYGSYIDTIGQMKTTSDGLKQRLKLDESGKITFGDPKMFKEQYKRLKFSLCKSEYDDLINQLRQSNHTLDRMTTQTLCLENLQLSSKRRSRSIPNFNVIHERVKGFHAGLCASWKCPCSADHSVNLQLEARIEDVAGNDEGESRDQFHVIFRYSQKSARVLGKSTAPWTWQEADVHLTCDKDDDGDGAGAETEQQQAKTVRFGSQPKDAVRAALEPQPNMQSIRDLCAAIQTLRSLQRDVCLSLLTDEYAKQKYGILIYPPRQRQLDCDSWSILSLRSVLNDPTFTRHNRLQLAVILASSVLQLHQTPWLQENWGKDHIFFINRADHRAYNQPFVSQHFNQADPETSIPNISHASSSYMTKIIRNQTLFALGITLIELWYGKTLQDLRIPEDEDGSDNLGGGSVSHLTMADWNTADRLIDALYSDAGEKYSDAVRRCIRCDFDRRASNLNDDAFQRAVYDGVVTQLKENLDFLYQ